MGKIKEKIKSNKSIYWLYKSYRNRYKLTKKYTIVNRGANSSELCIILAGYKDFLWPVTMERIKKCIPKEYDVCIVSSGMYSKELSGIAENYNWSYLSVKRNNVALAQNVAIKEFKNAKSIFKIDEDIFVTKNMFEIVEKTYNSIQDYNVGIVSPLLPINGFGHFEILKKYNLTEYYAKHFERPVYATGPDRMVESNPDVAKFFWGKDGLLKSIDDMSVDFGKDDFKYSTCPIKLSIGCIYFKREFWEKMGMFKVNRKGSGMGNDEVQINEYCITDSKPIVVSENTVVGHLSFGTQNSEMKKYFLNNIEEFRINK